MDYNNNQWQQESIPQPAKADSNNFAIASLICGIISILLCFTIIFSLPLGALGIIFAVLSKRRTMKLAPSALVGSILSSISVAFSILMVIFSVLFMKNYSNNPSFREKLNELYVETYGVTLDDYLEENGIRFDYN